MMALLNFVLIIIFVCFIIVCVVAYRVYRSFRDVAKKFGFKGGAGSRGASRQLRGNMRHQQGMRPHIVEHFVLVPEGEAGFVIRNDGSARLRRKRGMPGKRRFGKGIQRMPATNVFRRNGMGCQYGAHSGTMPPSPAQGKAGNCNLPVHAPR